MVLGELPPDLLDLAYRRWIGGDEPNRRFWPTPGIFAGMVKSEASVRRVLARRAEDTLTGLIEARHQ